MWRSTAPPSSRQQSRRGGWSNRVWQQRYSNDNLVFPVLNITTVVNSLLVGLAVGTATKNVVAAIVCGLLSWMVHVVILRVVYSGIVTIFVCYAECPEALEESNPVLRAEIDAAAATASTSTC